MAPRKGNESASWEVDADKPKPVGETRVRRSFCSKELTLRELLVLWNKKTCPTERRRHRFRCRPTWWQPRSSPSSLPGLRILGADRSGPEKGIDTVHDIMLYAGRTWGDKVAFGWRDILEVCNEAPQSPSSNMSTYSGKTGSTSTTSKSVKSNEKLRLSPYRWLSHTQALQEVRDLGSGLRQMGAGTRSAKGFFAIYSVSS